MHINWYPGHMKKTKDLIKNNLKLVDLAIELLDARIPISSKNPQINELIGNKKRLVLLNKSDLSDKKLLEEWINYYSLNNINAIPFNSITGEGMNKLLSSIKTLTKEKTEAMQSKGRKNRPVRIMIVGIPNVGKSSLINKLVGKKSAKTGNRPGVTKGKQWIRIRSDIELFDTPGILWPRIEDQIVGLNLAFTGSIKDEVLDIDTLGLKLIDKMSHDYPDLIKKRYKLEELKDSSLGIMEDIALKRGCIRSGRQIDYTKVANIILDEFRKGIIGRITLEKPNEAIDD